MDNDIIPQKSWWNQNRIWLIPATLILIIIIGIIYKSGITDLAQSYADPSIYDNALLKAKADNKVIEVLGVLEPIDKMAMLEGSVEFAGDKNSVNITVRVTGTKGSGKMDISANKKGAGWDYTKINIRVKKPADKRQTISIIPQINNQ